MAASLDTFKVRLSKLITKFDGDQYHYLSKDYLEAEARIDFITPFFEALGWDVENEAGLRHDEREVLVEKSESEMTGRPDYSFRVAGQTKFFVEAKAPSQPLDSPRHILQAKTYAWNTRQVFFVVLTDFAKLRFFDASIRPDERNPDEGRLLKLAYTEYLDNAEKLWEFSKERVLAGSLDALLPRDRRTQRLRIPVDQAFLEEMTGWREDLARNIFKNNPGLSARQLNEIVQRLLDRIVFIRIAEDRRIVEKRQLADGVDEWKARGGKFHIFEWLGPLFAKINDDFNGEIFKHNALLEGIKLDSEVLARIIERLYPPRSPYRFDVIGVELLGSIYERYLGNTIRPTARQVRVEEKPEVRHAGGVYYTPKYVVDYIVKNTVGKVIEGKTPKQIEKIRILDPACGSGSFLIGAFQCLIDYHTQWYLAHPEQEVRHAHPSLDFMREVRTDADGTKRLSVYRKAKILRHNLFGVDIDPQAVEITMMSLYLKALEGEQSQLPPKQHLLPELKYNIMCGNSLIGPDIYDQGALFADEERDRINAFDWNFVPAGAGLVPALPRGAARPRARAGGAVTAPSALPSIGQVMKDGGFDVVIGNPPYVRQESISEFKVYFQTHYQSFDGVADLYVYFMEKGLSLLREGGYYSIIVSSSFLRTNFAERLRAFLKKAAATLRIVDFGGLAVFENAKDIYVCIPLLAKQKQPEKIQVAKITSLDFEDLDSNLAPVLYTIPHQRLTPEAWSLKTDAETDVYHKIMRAGHPLGDYVERKFFRGVTTGLNDAFMIDSKTRLALIAKDPSSSELIKPLVGGEDIRRWVFHNKDLWLIFTRRGVEIESYPAIKEHLSSWKAELTPKRNSSDKVGRKPGRYKWYEIQDDVAYHQIFDSPKIIFPDIAKGPRFCLDTKANYLANTAYCLGTDDKYLLAILNSRLFWFAISNISIPFGIRAGEYRYRLIYQYMEKVPIRPIDFSDSGDKARHDKIVSLVECMLELNKKKQSGKLAPSELDRTEREIAATDSQIDELVYELYWITDEERRTVEGASHE